MTTATKKISRGVVALGGILFLCLTASLASAGEVEERIRALEEVQRANAAELEKLKGEQIELKKEATAAAAALPTFEYRPGAGLTLTAADGNWGFRTRIRWHYRLMFFPDKDGVAKHGFSQFDLALRRIYPYMTFYWDKGFYEVDYQMNLNADRSINIQKAEFTVHFDHLNPYLPELTIGPRVSGFLNRHDTNWGSASGGLFDRTMFQDGANIGAGSHNNGMNVEWRSLPIGPGEMLFEAMVSNQGTRSEEDQTRPNSDKRSALLSTNIQPFSKLKNKWIEGIDFGFGALLENMHPNQDNRDLFRVRTTERQRLRLIEVNNNMSGFRYYLTPGFGWKIGPYWLRTAGGFNRGHVDSPLGGEKGPLVKGSMWRIAHELFVWSPKGVFTGSTRTPGSVMFFTGFERDDYKASGNGTRNGLRDCSSVTLNGECHGAYAYNYNVGMWYFIRNGLSVGGEYGFYHVNKIGRGGNDIVNSGDKSGKAVDFNTLEFGLRVEW